uniref:Protein translocase subunit SecA n=1 Tax=Sphondylothamnion multifidum TaxID=193186 RepID=A0A4D6WYB2_9FLOR|nr:Preprotein-translocase subunit a [Sphondylothamnion multifidum]
MFNFLIKNPLNKYKTKIEEINIISNELKKCSDKELQNITNNLKKKIQTNSISLDSILIEAFGTAKEAIRRATKLIVFDVQLIGAIILHQGNIAEMKTGEGKTIVAILSGYLNTLNNKEVHIITVNDYLAERDANLSKQICNYLNIKVGLITQKTNYKERKKMYKSDILYITNSELGFDYLRDNMAIEDQDLVQTNFNYAIIDEVDSILIDEARTPLIISGPSQIDSNKYLQANEICQKLTKNQHYDVDEKAKNIILTEKGVHFCEKLLNINNLYDINNPWIKYVLNALKAKELFLKNKDYIVKNAQIIIVDEFTGRLMDGRRWSDGLHQAIEAKENVSVQPENKTLASITYQNLFLLYDKLCGMTGTAKTEEAEFYKIYKLSVIEIPTNKTCKRKDLPDLVYKSEYNKWQSIANECFDMYQQGRPTLIGTTSIEKSELLAKMLDTIDIPYNLLNAKPENIAREAEIITQAGQKYAITISTNMAGRGTDIILGGNPYTMSKILITEYIKNRQNVKKFYRYINDEILDLVNPIYQYKDNIKKHIQSNDSNDIAKYIDNIINKGSIKNLTQEESHIFKIYQNLVNKYKNIFEKEKEQVLKLGGLYVIGTERHESRRIDNQLRGRSGRQGDKGTSRFFLSLQDNLFRIFGGEKIENLMKTLKIDDEIPIESLMLSKSLNSAQKKVESYFYDVRKQLFEYDEVINSQREAIYTERKRILKSSFTRDCILEYGEHTINEMLKAYEEEIDTLTKKNILLKIIHLFNLTTDFKQPIMKKIQYNEVRKFLFEQLRITYDLRESHLEQIRPGLMRQLEKYYLLQQIDKAWQEHLEKMVLLKEYIGWRSYGQQDPLIEYKNEAFNLFINMVTYIRHSVIYLTMRSRLVITE